VKTLIPAKTAEATQTTQYTATNFSATTPTPQRIQQISLLANNENY
jgi:hypothetical protein